MKCVTNILIYILNVMFQVLVTFKFVLRLRIRGRFGAIILLSKKNCGIPYSFLPSLVIIHQGREDIFLSRGSLFPEKRGLKLSSLAWCICYFFHY
jgi:hypothetical protein